MSKPVAFSVRLPAKLARDVEVWRAGCEIKPSKCEAINALVIRGLLLTGTHKKYSRTDNGK
jgi:hypothetical protein